MLVGVCVCVCVCTTVLVCTWKERCGTVAAVVPVLPFLFSFSLSDSFFESFWPKIRFDWISGKFKIYFESISNENGEMKTRWLNEFPSQEKKKKKKKLDIMWRWAMLNMASLSLLSPLIRVFKWTYGQTSDGQTYNSLHHSSTLNKIPSQFLEEENSFTLARVESFSQEKTKKPNKNDHFQLFLIEFKFAPIGTRKKKKNTTGGPIFLFPILWSMYSFSTFHFFFRCRYLLRWLSSFIVGRCRRLSVGSAVIGHSVQPVCGFTGRKLQTEKKNKRERLK